MIPRGVLAEGTVDEVMAEVDDSPAHTWGESRNPANQWLKNIMGQNRHAKAVHNAGVQARLEVRRLYREAGYPLPPMIRSGER